jgi:hypothetical protein
VGRTFGHDKKAVFSSGVLTPEGIKTHFSAAYEGGRYKS